MNLPGKRKWAKMDGPERMASLAAWHYNRRTPAERDLVIARAARGLYKIGIEMGVPLVRTHDGRTVFVENPEKAPPICSYWIEPWKRGYRTDMVPYDDLPQEEKDKLMDQAYEVTQGGRL